MYQIGDYIVKPVKGVCEIEDIVTPDFVDDKKMYYQLAPLSEQHTKVYVPVDKADANIRSVMTQTEAEALIRKIPDIDEEWIFNEKERERNYKEAIQSNDPVRIVGIIKLIYQRKRMRQKQGKRTTAVDGKYFDMAEKLLYSELEVSMKCGKNEIDEQIRKYCTE